jgi:hypothetical protein
LVAAGAIAASGCGNDRTSTPAPVTLRGKIEQTVNRRALEGFKASRVGRTAERINSLTSCDRASSAEAPAGKRRFYCTASIGFTPPFCSETGRTVRIYTVDVDSHDQLAIKDRPDDTMIDVPKVC